MFFDQGIFAMKRDGVEIQIKGFAPFKTKLVHGIEPQAQHFWVAGWINPATVFGKKCTFGRTVESRKEGKAFIQHIAHDMTIAGCAKELQGK